MKANKAPEKIYVRVKDGKAFSIWNIEWVGVNDIEYVQTDAFIEKACEYWYKYNRDIVNKRCCEFTVNVEDFRKYMEGE